MGASASIEPEATVFTNIAPGSADVVRPWVEALRNVGFAVFAKPKVDEDSDVDSDMLDHIALRRGEGLAAVLVASRESKSGSVGLHQDVDLHVVTLRKNQAHSHQTGCDRKIWLQMIKGEIELEGEARLKSGDGAAIKDKTTLTMSCVEDARFLLFDLP